jgi:hypothetical protein
MQSPLIFIILTLFAPSAGEARSMASQPEERLDPQVRQEILDLSQQYRTLTHAHFDADPTEYARRIAMWRQLIDRWQRSRTRIQHADRVVRWLRVAVRRTDDKQALPELPDFGVLEPERFGVSLDKPHAADLLHPRTRPLERANLSSSTINSSLPEVEQVDGPNALPLSPQAVTRPEESLTPQLASPPRPVRAAVSTVAPVEPPPGTTQGMVSEARIELTELTARISGYNSALKRLVGQLQSDDIWSAEQLAEALHELNDLAAHKSQLTLYHDLISDDERLAVGEPAPLGAAVSLLGAKIFATREAIANRAGGGARELTSLDQLSRQLAKLASSGRTAKPKD